MRVERPSTKFRIQPASSGVFRLHVDANAHSLLLFSRDALQQVWKLRRVLNGLASEGRDAAGLELLIDKLKSTKSNDEFLAEIGRGPASTS